MIDQNSTEALSIEIFRQLFTALTEEMGSSLRRAAFSPNIKERRDYSCALFNPLGIAVALGDHMPVHLGAMPLSVKTALDELGPLEKGDVACLNDPYRGGTHLPDITMISPVIANDSSTNLGYVASRAHHSDVGGMTPGSMPLAREIYQEGLIIPPIKLYRKGEINEELYSLILANVRTPVERRGDLEAQLAALHTGAKRLLEIASKHGSSITLHFMDRLIDYADRLVLLGLKKIPNGTYVGKDFMDDDGFGKVDIPVCIKIIKHSKGLDIDFSGSSRQVTGGINAVEAITSSATRYVIRCVIEHLLGESLPAGGGSMSAVNMILPNGSIVNANPPASVAAGNVETSQRITDVLLLAFAEALPDLIPALSQGTMNNLTIGGSDPRVDEPFTYYETAGGGMGAGPNRHGLSGVHTHMSNSLNTPIEALEHAYPFQVEHYSIIRESGGKGLFCGGDGLRREIKLLADSEVTLLTERRRRGPLGMHGGEDGSPGKNILTRDGKKKILPAKISFQGRQGDIVGVHTPGAGGWSKTKPEGE